MSVSKLILFCVLIFTCITCKKQKLENLEGNWVQVNSVNSLPFGGVTRYDFVIANAKFKMIRHSVTDVVISNPIDSLSYDEFMIGDVDISNKKLIFKGYYTDNSYKISDSLCFNVGKFYEAFGYRIHNKNLILTYNKIEFVLKKQ